MYEYAGGVAFVIIPSQQNLSGQSVLQKCLLLFCLLLQSAVVAAQSSWVLNVENPVLVPGNLGEWDDFKIGSPSVLEEDGIYRMWFRGCHFVGRDYGCAVGEASSSNGITWQKKKSPVLTLADPSESKGLHSVSVVKVGSQFVMFYSVSADLFKARPFAKLFLATSPDGLTWKKEGSVAGAIHKNTISLAPTVLHDGSIFHLWYIDSPDPNGLPALMHLSSFDGKTWNTQGTTPLSKLHLEHFGPGTSGIALLREYAGAFVAFSPLSAPGFRILRSQHGTNWEAGAGESLLLPEGKAPMSPNFIRTKDGIRAWFVIKTERGVESIGTAFHSGRVLK